MNIENAFGHVLLKETSQKLIYKYGLVEQKRLCLNKAVNGFSKKRMFIADTLIGHTGTHKSIYHICKILRKKRWENTDLNVEKKRQLKRLWESSKIQKNPNKMIQNHLWIVDVVLEKKWR